MSFDNLPTEMFMDHSVSKCPFKSVIVLQLLFWNVHADWKNNLTLIKIINEKKSSWTAGVNTLFLAPSPSTEKPNRKGLPTVKPEPVQTPDSFDAREHWKKCDRVLNQIRDQGKCGSCWAVATASMLSDRTCVATNGSIRVSLSAEDLVSCCDICRRNRDWKAMCEGAFPGDAVYYWMKEGIVTGETFGSKKGCKPYSNDLHNGKPMQCTKTCTNKKHWKEYDEDKHLGKMAYFVNEDEESIKREIFTNGPVLAIFLIYMDFYQYKTGVYRHLSGEFNGSHALKLIGWGEDKGEKYWLAVNSWGRKFGDKGVMKFLRGVNHLYIEALVLAGRMFDVASSHNRMRKAAASGARRESLHFSTNLLLWLCYIRIFKETL